MIARLIGRVVTYAPLIIWTVICLLPFVLIILLAFRDNNGIYTYPLGVGGTYHPENFSTAWVGPVGSAGMAAFFGNSLIALLSALAVNLVLGAFGAYYVTQLSRRFSTIYLTVFVLGTVVPFVLLLIPYYRVFSALELLSNPCALGVTYGIITLPTTVLILNAFFSDFPKDLVDAGKIDGLGNILTFTKIVLPLSKGALAAVGLLMTISVWGETQLAFVLLQDASSQTIAIGVLGFQGQYQSDLGPIFAGLTLAAVPVIVLYLIFSRFITKGIALGGAFK